MGVSGSGFVVWVALLLAAVVPVWGYGQLAEPVKLSANVDTFGIARDEFGIPFGIVLKGITYACSERLMARTGPFQARSGLYFRFSGQSYLVLGNVETSGKRNHEEVEIWQDGSGLYVILVDLRPNIDRYKSYAAEAGSSFTITTPVFSGIGGPTDLHGQGSLESLDFDDYRGQLTFTIVEKSGNQFSRLLDLSASPPTVSKLSD